MISLDDLRKLCPQTKVTRLQRFVAPLDEAMREFEIDNVARETAFLAQIAHESGAFNYVRELASGEAYEGRAELGNTRPEAIAIAAEHGSTPGRWWRGHGLIQITGFDNHADCSVALYGNRLVLLHEPSRLEQPLDATRSAGWFWSSRSLNELADRGDFRGLTKCINGGYRGMQERLDYLARAQEILT